MLKLRAVPYKTLATLSTLVVCGGAAAAFAAFEATSTRSAVVAPVLPTVAAVPDDLRAHFAILRVRRSTADDLSASALKYLDDANSISGRNNALAHGSSTAAGRAWIIPGNGKLPGGPRQRELRRDMHRQRFAESQGLDVESVRIGDPDVPFAALLPDRSSATVTYKDGRAERLQPTADGMVSATLRGAESVAIMSPTATRIVRIPDPMTKMTYGALPRGR